MVFTSPTFLFLFLPLTLACYFVLRYAARTPFLVLVSLLFYAWGEKDIVFVLSASMLLNWALALVIERTPGGRRRKLLVSAAVLLNIGALVYFKYSNSLVANLNVLRAHLGRPAVVIAPVRLPIGVSFVTFEALSYVVDVYRGESRAARNPFHVAFYISFFPHLIAGPILRFRDIAGSVRRPKSSVEDFEAGTSRFITGLAKKMLLANPLGEVADAVFVLPAYQLGAATAWLGVAAYTLQIYLDFSAYTDMAIGIGKFFGFSLPENFRLPYTADSIRDFWRRWHMTLSSWFRDYLFIPLGGSRNGRLRTYFNLLTVFLLCGLWHGANVTFIAWGAFHGTFLVLERSPFGSWLERAPRPLRHCYAMLVVAVGWVFFRTYSLDHALFYFKAMAGALHGHGPTPADYLSLRIRLAFILGAFVSVAPLAAWREQLRSRLDGAGSARLRIGMATAELALLSLCMIFVAAGTYNPFIYFRF